MLGLLSNTDSAWAEGASRQLDALLADHAHCELKAAQTALSIVARFGGEHPSLIEPLTALAAEETEHFQQVHGELRARDFTLSPPHPDFYVTQLQQAAKQLRDAPLLLRRLLVSALIEARSCERFHVLSKFLRDESLRQFYALLMASEARHCTLFRTLAADCFDVNLARTTYNQLAECEANIARSLPLEPWVHG